MELGTGPVEGNVMRRTSFVVVALAASLTLAVPGALAAKRFHRTGHRSAHNDTSPGNSGSHKTTICHATGSETNPYVLITVDNHALKAHSKHQDDQDIIPAPVDANGKAYCPTPPGPTDNPPPTVTTPPVTPTADVSPAATTAPAATPKGAVKGKKVVHKRRHAVKPKRAAGFTG